MSTHCCDCGAFLYSQRDGGSPTYLLSIVVGQVVSNMEKTICRECFGKFKESEIVEPTKLCFMVDTKDAFVGSFGVNHKREFFFYPIDSVQGAVPKSYAELIEHVPVEGLKQLSLEENRNWVNRDKYIEESLA